MEGEIKAGAQKKMEAVRHQDHFADIPGTVTADVVSGQPAGRDHQVRSPDNDIDLIITATHGRKGLEHAIFGSVAENVVRNSPVPVLTVNPYKLK